MRPSIVRLVSLGLLALLISAPLRAQDSVKIMPMGDSITELDWEGGYRSFLYKLLSDSGFTFDYVGRKNNNHNDASLGFKFPAAYWDHEGYSGRAIYPTWLDSVGRALRANPPQIIMLMAGTNDVSNGTRSALQIKNFMSSLLDSIWTFNPNIQVVLSNLPRIVRGSLFSQAKLDTIVRVNALWPDLVASKISANRPLIPVDNYSALTDTLDFTSDGIHPSVAGYKKMRFVWYPGVVLALQRITAVGGSSDRTPESYELGPNYPNPFNPSTTITYALPSQSHATLSVFNTLGQKVAELVNEEKESGIYDVRFNASGLASGVYLYRLQAGTYSETKKLVLTK
jgi:lysophospholipase L1-like esterase